jgi:nitroreductase
MNYPDVLELMQARRSIRKFTKQKPTHDDIECLVEAARWSPSNHNRQGWKFIVFEDQDELHTLAEQVRNSLQPRLEQSNIPIDQAEKMLHHATFFADAPVVILAMHKKPVAMGRALLAETSNGELASGETISVAMAVQNISLTAEAMGLGACVLTAPLLSGEVWAKVDDLPLGFLPTCIIAVGYPEDRPMPPRRKPLEQIMEYRK